jgi:phage terminase large subunit-like protein
MSNLSELTILSVPEVKVKDKLWPTLGPQVCDFIEENLIFGPGDLRGQPARVSDLWRGLIYRLYEVYPKDHAEAGRRRFKRGAISLRKGLAKTEWGAWITACELHPEGPVRCAGWDGQGEPIGRGVNDPYIPMVAYTEEQSDDLAYWALYVILREGKLAADFDIGLERIMRINGDGKAVALASAPDSRDGARTTFQLFDETHRFTLPRLRGAHRTMMANTAKRFIADPWSLEVTTAYSPGENSVAEATMDYARAVADGKLKDSKLFFFHRQASDKHDISTAKGARAAVLEASGADAGWSDIGAICDLARDPTTDITYWERVWLNRIRQQSSRAFDTEKWRALARADQSVPAGEKITVGFSGSRYDDSTGIVGTDIRTGFQWLIAVWEKDLTDPEWTVPELEVDAAVVSTFARWKVWRMYADPRFWENDLAHWAGRYGDKKVLSWPTNRLTQMAAATDNFAAAIAEGELTHDGHPILEQHIGNSCRKETPYKDPEGRRLWVPIKERPDSPMKIDCARAAILSWEARTDAVTAGEAKPKQPALAIGRDAHAGDGPEPAFRGVRGQRF